MGTDWDEFMMHLHDKHNIPVSRMRFSYNNNISCICIYVRGFGYMYVPVSQYMVGFVNEENDMIDLIAELIGEGDPCKFYMIGEDGINISEIIMARGAYSCSICGKRYDTVSKEILKSHIDECSNATLSALRATHSASIVTHAI